MTSLLTFHFFMAGIKQMDSMLPCFIQYDVINSGLGVF